jgi:hypothetical protein
VLRGGGTLRGDVVRASGSRRPKFNPVEVDASGRQGARRARPGQALKARRLRGRGGCFEKTVASRCGRGVSFALVKLRFFPNIVPAMRKTGKPPLRIVADPDRPEPHLPQPLGRSANMDRRCGGERTRNIGLRMWLASRC